MPDKKRFAVGYINFYDNELTIETVWSYDRRTAILLHSKLQSLDVVKWLRNMPNRLEEIKTYFFDCDSMIDVKEIDNAG